MEVRFVDNGPGKLSAKVFFSDESGFSVCTVILMGEKDAAILDAQWSLSNGHRVVAEILETGKTLKYIYVTHAHPDHYFGLGPIKDAFPEAKVIALPEVASTINKQMFGKVDHWVDIIGPTNVPTKAVNIEPMENNFFDLEGHRVEIMPRIMGDLKYNTVVWVPSIKLLYGSDVLFNESHPFTCEITAEERKQWLADVEMLEKLGAETVIPGHQKPGMPFDASCFEYMKKYLKYTEEELSNTETTGDFFLNMALHFPGSNLLFLSNEMNAAVFKGGRDWEWRDEDLD
jgi:glyoxylase-like metal-dependent hydrolase (beta-lactamase superfamily II)